MPRLFFPLILLFCSIFGLSQAQENSMIRISADKLQQLQVISSFPCAGERPKAAFHGALLVTNCRIENRSTILVYSVSDAQEISRYNAGVRYGYDFRVLGDDVLLVSTADNITIYRNQGQDSISQEYHMNTSLAISPDNSHIAFVTGNPLIVQDNYEIFIDSLPDFEPIESNFSIAANVQSAELALSNADTSLIAIGEYGGRIQIFNWETGELATEIPNTSFITTMVGEYGSGTTTTTEYAWLAFSPDASELFSNQCIHQAMGCYEMGLSRFDSATGEILASAAYPNSGDFNFVGFIVESRLLLHSTGCGMGLNFYDMNSLNQLEYFIPAENCGGESYYAVNEAGTLIAVYDEANTQFLLYGIPAE